MGRPAGAGCSSVSIAFLTQSVIARASERLASIAGLAAALPRDKNYCVYCLPSTSTDRYSSSVAFPHGHLTVICSTFFSRLAI